MAPLDISSLACCIAAEITIKKTIILTPKLFLETLVCDGKIEGFVKNDT